jgi:hypothetical protein
MLDKGRATLAKKNGEYNYNSPTDQHLVRFLGFDPDALLKELAAGKGDGEILAWVLENSKTPRGPWEVEAWSAYFDKRSADSDAETLAGFAEYVGQHSNTREGHQVVVRCARPRRLRQLWGQSVSGLSPQPKTKSKLRKDLSHR